MCPECKRSKVDATNPISLFFKVYLSNGYNHHKGHPRELFAYLFSHCDQHKKSDLHTGGFLQLRQPCDQIGGFLQPNEP